MSASMLDLLESLSAGRAVTMRQVREEMPFAKPLEQLQEFHRRHDAHLAEIEAAWQAAPSTDVRIERPSQCRRRDGCDACLRAGLQWEERETGGEFGPRRVRYDARPCHAVVTTEALLRLSGLTAMCAGCLLVESGGREIICDQPKARRAACEYAHTFAAATRDSHNRAVLDILALWTPASRASIYLVSAGSPGNELGCGTGKSYALHALVQASCRAGVRAKLVRDVDFLSSLRASYGQKAREDGAEPRESEESILATLERVPVLAWDDWGTGRFTDSDWAGERYYRIMDTRQRAGLPILVSSNLGLEAACARFGDHGQRILSRLAGMVEKHVYALGGPDRRMEGKR